MQNTFVFLEILVIFIMIMLMAFFIWRDSNAKKTIKNISFKSNNNNKNTKDLYDLSNILLNTIDSTKNKIPSIGIHHLNSIHKNILNLIPKSIEEQWNNKNINNAEVAQNIGLIQNIVLKYIPNTLDDFLKLPKEFSTNHKNNENKTAADLLVESLAVLDRSMYQFSTTIFETDLTDMKIHRNFLYEKFNENSSHFK